MKGVRDGFVRHGAKNSPLVVGPLLMIYASDVAAACGQHKYRTSDEAFNTYMDREPPAETILQKLPDAVQKTVLEIEKQAPESIEELKSVDTEIQKTALNTDVFTTEEKEVLRTDLDQASKLLCEKGFCSEDADAAEVAAVANEVVDKKTLTQEEEVVLKQELVSRANKSFGTRKEGSAIQLYEEQVGPVLHNNDRCYYLSYLKDGLRLFSVCGKIDGICNGKLVEVKNRKNRFFTPIPVYDRVQILTYLKMLDMETADLVECLQSSKGPQIKITEVSATYPPEAMLWEAVEKGLEEFAMRIYEARRKT